MKNKYFGSEFYSSTLNTILLFVLIILMVIALRFMYRNQETYLLNLKNKSNIVMANKTIPNIKNKLQIIGDKDDLIIFSLLPNSKVKGMTSYKGTVKGGYFFEGSMNINILDSNKDILKKSNVISNDEWATSNPVNFEGTIDFTDIKKGPAYFEIHNNNASGLPENDKSILIPIIIE